MIGLVLGAAMISTEAAKVPGAIDPALVPYYAVASETVAAGGQPSAEALPRLKALGFRTVVNLRQAGEPGTEGYEERVRAAGLRYVHVPVTPETFSRADLDRIVAALEDPEAGPTLLHCSSANRVGGVWTAMQVRKGRAWEDAEKEGRALGLRRESMIEAVKRVLGEPPPKR